MVILSFVVPVLIGFCCVLIFCCLGKWAVKKTMPGLVVLALPASYDEYYDTMMPLALTPTMTLLLAHLTQRMMTIPPICEWLKVPDV